MNKHTLHLHPEPFMKLLTGNKQIETRIYDAKRQAIKPGDEITFINRLDDYSLKAKVVAIHLAGSFKELFESIDADKLGDNSIADLLEELNEYYSDEQQERHGVVGIEIKKK